MANKQTVNANSQLSNNDSDVINLRAFLIKYIDHWKLIAASLAIAMTVAFVYYKYIKPIYQITASLELQDSNEKPPEEKSSLVVFQELEKVNAPKVVENEIRILKSNQLIKDVVDYFQLWAEYKLEGGIIKDEDIYGRSPVKYNSVTPILPGLDQKLVVHVLDTNYYTFLGRPGDTTKHRFGEVIGDKAGSWSITAADNIDKFVGNNIQIKLSDPESVVLGYQNSVIVEAEEKPASLIDISINDQNVKRGEDFINYLIYFYKQAEILEKSKTTKSTLAFIDRRLDSLSGQLNHAENNIAGYRSGNGLADLSGQSQIYMQEVQANGEKLNEINIQLNVINKLENYFNQTGNNDTDIPSALGISDQRLTDLVGKLSDLQLERSKLLATTPEKNPAFEPIDKGISSLKSAIKEDLKNIKSSLLTTQQSLESFKSNAQTSIQNVPGQQRELQGLSRQQSTKETLYNYLLQEREQISLSYASASANVRVVDDAHIIPLKSSKKFIPFGVALVLGLIFPAGFIYGKDLIRHTVDSRKEVETETSIPVIAELSYIKLASPIVFDNRDDPESFILIEQFRNLRTQLSFLNDLPSGAYFVLVTSSAASEGKSMVSSSLAVSLASTGKKIMLVETDVYKPTISRMFKLSGKFGLTEYLNKKADKKKIIQKPSAYPNLHIIGSGAFVDNFSELLEQKSIENLFNDLKPDYDYIIFDTAPIHAVSDAYTLGKFCDVTLYLVRAKQTSKSLLPFIKKLNDNQNLPKMNIVFNGLEKGRDSQGYKYENYYRRQ